MGQATRGHAARLHTQRTQERLYTLTGIDELRARLEKIKPQNGGEPEVVPGLQLGELLNDWRERYEVECPVVMKTTHEGYVTRQHEPPGPIEYLTSRTGIAQRTLWSIMNGKREWVGLGTADKLLCAIDRLDVLHSDELPIHVNPMWKPARWIAYMRTALEVVHRDVTIRELKELQERARR